MKNFQWTEPQTIEQAISLLARANGKAVLMAGGTDLFTEIKEGIVEPDLVIDLKSIPGLTSIQKDKDGVRIGALTTVAGLAADAMIKLDYAGLSAAAGSLATPQLRNVGTVGGNLCQRPRCWYFRGKLFKDCLRKGGDNCYALSGENQYHAIFPADNCCMVCPSDMATALTALGASVEIATPKGKKLISIEQFYLRPEKNPLRETVLGPTEMVLSVVIPAPVPGSKGIYLKLKEREAFDFAITSVAAIVTLKDDLVSVARIVLGGVGPAPLRATGAEAALKGKKMRDGVVTACAAAVKGARPLSGNVYKVKATKGIMEKALTSLA